MQATTRLSETCVEMQKMIKKCEATTEIAIVKIFKGGSRFKSELKSLQDYKVSAMYRLTEL